MAQSTGQDVHQGVLEHLEEDIVFGRLRPRERLIEEDLVARFGVKRHGIRQALSELEHKGLVVRTRGKGARVRDFGPGEIQHLYGMRELLETEAANQIPLPADSTYLETLVGLVHAHADALDKGDLAFAFRANIRFHRHLFSACSNPYLVEAIEFFAQKANAIRSYSIADPGLIQHVLDEHNLMIETIRKGDRDGLVNLCRKHLKLSREAYLKANQAVLNITD